MLITRVQASINKIAEIVFRASLLTRLAVAVYAKMADQHKQFVYFWAGSEIWSVNSSLRSKSLWCLWGSNSNSSCCFFCGSRLVSHLPDCSHASLFVFERFSLRACFCVFICGCFCWCLCVRKMLTCTVDLYSFSIEWLEWRETICRQASNTHVSTWHREFKGEKTFMYSSARNFWSS